MLEMRSAELANGSMSACNSPHVEHNSEIKSPLSATKGKRMPPHDQRESVVGEKSHKRESVGGTDTESSVGGTDDARAASGVHKSVGMNATNETSMSTRPDETHCGARGKGKRRRTGEADMGSSFAASSNIPSAQTALPNEPLLARKERSDSLEPTPEELSKMSRSERKRHREKKRRSDVNKGFDDLTNLLITIDPTIKSEAEARKKIGAGMGDDSDQAPLNRVDLISRAVVIMERLYRENEANKRQIAELLRYQGRQTQSPEDQVMMMLPIIAPHDPRLEAARVAQMRQQQAIMAQTAQVRPPTGTSIRDVLAGNYPPGDLLGFGIQGLQRLAAGANFRQAEVAALTRPSASVDEKSSKAPKAPDEKK